MNNLELRSRVLTRSVRYASGFWLQSLIQGDQMRQSLFELQSVTTSLAEKGVQGQKEVLLRKPHQIKDSEGLPSVILGS